MLQLLRCPAPSVFPAIRKKSHLLQMPNKTLQHLLPAMPGMEIRLLRMREAVPKVRITAVVAAMEASIFCFSI
jgi:hypothetical protein